MTTFLFTDIAGSTRLWQQHPAAMETALAAHDQLLNEAVIASGGRVFKHTGDGMAAVFDDPVAAVKAATDIQRRLTETPHDEVGALSIRIGIHTGTAAKREGDYFGLAVSRTARLMDAGHGGQVLCSAVTGELVKGAGIPLVDLGEHRLRDLTSPERIYQVTVDGMADEFPRLRTLDAAPNNLPHFTTSFIGREVELGELDELLAQHRMVTISGVGGAGKTRLALHVAADVAPGFSDGVWLVELATVTDPDAIDAAVVSALNLQQSSGTSPRQAILEHVSAREMLIVVDNCEHLIDAAAGLIDDILNAAPNVSVIATSRELLGIGGEVSYRLRSMAVPDRDEQDLQEIRSADAIGLFLERAATGRPDFAVTSENASTVAEICRRLDGMPLAIELAAARLRSFSLEQVASYLDQRFRLLTGGARTAMPRQQTLTAAIDWSYRLLSEPEKALFRRLSVFSGGFTFEAVEAVCTGDPIVEFDVLELLPALVDKSLVVVDEVHGASRYGLLETLRQYARDRLDEEGNSDSWRRRHAQFFARLSGPNIRRRIWGPDGPEIRRKIHAEMANLRQAMTWAIGAGEAELAIASLYPYSRISLALGQWSELLTWCEQMADLVTEETAPLDRASWLMAYGAALYLGGDNARAIELVEESVAIFRDLDGQGMDGDVVVDFARALNNLSMFLLYSDRAGPRNEIYTEIQGEVLELGRRSEDQFTIAMALANLAHHRDPGGDPVAARRLFEEAEEAARGLGSDRLAGLASQRAFFEFSQGEWEEAARQFEAAGRHSEDLDTADPQLRAGLAACRVEQGDLSAADDFVATASEILADPETRSGMTSHQLLLAFGAGVDRALGLFERVAAASGASQALAERDLTVRWDLVDYLELAVDEARSTLDEEVFDAALHRGRSMNDDQLTSFVVESRPPMRGA